KGTDWKPLPLTGSGELRPARWELEFRHIDGSVKKGTLDSLVDLKDRPDWVSFASSVLYRTEVDITDPAKPLFLNLGKVYGVSELAVNGQPAGVQWYGRRVFPLAGKLKAGRNTLEIKVTTSMGNYMKTLTDNAVAQYWTNTGRKNQPIQSMGILGPVTLYF
ncbi:MAG: hypothetical protein J7576_17665, partial [Siphonobacter aquaeclarae]|nr:hypothetical protein [Siphonobacter aquaeclarae]